MTIQRFRAPSRGHLTGLAGLIVASVLLGLSAQAQDPVSHETEQKPGEPAAKSSSVTVHEGKVQANGITIAYESFGPADRETILMIMGQGLRRSRPGPSNSARSS